MTQAHAKPNPFNSAAPRFYSIAAGRPFLSDLARTLYATLGDAPLSFSDMIILTPTRRAVRALSDAFWQEAHRANRTATILPRIISLGDIDEDEIDLFFAGTHEELNFPPAVSAMERKLILAQLVAAKDRAYSGRENWAAALSAANELAKLIDSFYTEEIDLSKLGDIAPSGMAQHWAESLKFLEIVTKAWPAHLASIDRMDPADRRVKLIDAQTRSWAASPPTHPIVVAGSTGSAPSVTRMMDLIARLDQGLVVLPGLDQTLIDNQGWGGIDDPHPQSGLKALLNSCAIDPAAVRHWPGSETLSDRQALLSLTLRPASATNDWRDLVQQAVSTDPALQNATNGLSIIEASDEETEATSIALIMRETLETAHKTAMLVTPDRDLSRRVAAKMARWGVHIDDSGGVPFHNCPHGVFLRLVASWLQNPADPVCVMAMVRHPLCRLGLSETDHRKAVTALDIGLRGLVPPSQSVAALEEKLSRARNSSLAAQAQPAIDALAKAAPENLHKLSSFAAVFDAHMRAAEDLASDSEEPGAIRLWRLQDGDIGAALMQQVGAITASIEAGAADYPSIFTELISTTTVRPTKPAHPRLLILGPLEARLQTADRVILGGLNEGVWPADAPIDPFLSRPMRAEIGLPSPERRHGLAAHDFAQLAAKDDVFLTRSIRAGGKPAKPSRWLVRLKNILSGANAFDRINHTQKYETLAALLNEPSSVQPVAPPQPRPPLAARPTSMFVTRVGKLLRDPYGVYASEILRLRPMDRLGEAFAARHFGELLHLTFEEFCKAHREASPEVPENVLRDLFYTHAARFGYRIEEDAFWKDAVAQTLQWFAGFHAEQLRNGAPAVIEGQGEASIDIDGQIFTISARADRIDVTNSGGADLIDYKFKSLPSLKQIRADFSPQLPLTGLIVQQGGFEGLPKTDIDGFHYIRVLDRHPDPRKNASGATGDQAKDAIKEAEQGLRNLISLYRDESHPYLSQPRPEFIDDYGDYDQLARRKEWQAQEDSP